MPDDDPKSRPPSPPDASFFWPQEAPQAFAQAVKTLTLIDRILLRKRCCLEPTENNSARGCKLETFRRVPIFSASCCPCRSSGGSWTVHDQSQSAGPCEADAA